jgi:hypothetical protein
VGAPEIQGGAQIVCPETDTHKQHLADMDQLGLGDPLEALMVETKGHFNAEDPNAFSITLQARLGVWDADGNVRLKTSWASITSDPIFSQATGWLAPGIQSLGGDGPICRGWGVVSVDLGGDSPLPLLWLAQGTLVFDQNSNQDLSEIRITLFNPDGSVLRTTRIPGWSGGWQILWPKLLVIDFDQNGTPDITVVRNLRLGDTRVRRNLQVIDLTTGAEITHQTHDMPKIDAAATWPQ